MIGEKSTVYLEKMPEHILRRDLLLMLEPSHVIIVERCWFDVALSISKFCVQKWYGYKSMKWYYILVTLKNLDFDD